jgi:glycosyltransferase involved in cell wall biosynthesis
VRRVALVLVGSRNLNKRICRFVESLHGSGFDPVVLAVPRGRWGTSGMEEPALVARRRRSTLGSSDRRGRVSRPDLVVCMHWVVLPLALAIKFALGVRIVYDEHDDYEMLALEASGQPWSNRVRRWCVARVHALCLAHVDLVTCIHQTGGRLELALHRRASTVVELHNYPSERWAARPGERSPSGGSVAVVYIGGVWEEKGCGLMLDALALLDAAGPPVTLHVFGRGDPSIERRMTATAGVTFHGSVVPDVIIEFLARHECVGLAVFDATDRYSLVSTNPHKLFEYLAAGAPVLATDVGDVGDLIAALDAGWVVEAGADAQTVADALSGIVARPHELRRRGDAAAQAMVRDGRWWSAEWDKVVRSGVLDR